MQIWLLLLFFFPLSLQAQKLLKAGLYYDLKPKETIVLDTGSFTFIGLEMKGLGDGIWLDARNASSLKLLGCQFEADHSGTAVFTSGNTNIEHSRFLGLKIGMKMTSSFTRYSNAYTRLSIKTSHFWGNEKSIYLAEGSVGVQVLCNYFSPGNLKKAIGLFVDSVAWPFLFQLNNSGGNEPLSGGNIWPKKANDFESPDGWTSLWNQNLSERIDYRPYLNEFVGNTFPISGKGAWHIQASQISPAPYYLRQFCMDRYPKDQEKFKQCTSDPISHLNLGFQLLPDLCYHYDDPKEAAVDSSQMALGAYLGDVKLVPNTRKGTLELYWTEEKGKLIVFDLATGRQVMAEELKMGIQKIKLDISALAAGVYGYRLEGNCPCPEPKRLVVVK